MNGTELQILKRRMISQGNPLVRPVDRAEARLVPLLLLLALVAIPVALTVGSSVGYSQLQIMEKQHRERVEATATLLEDAPGNVASAYDFRTFMVSARAIWPTSSGGEQTGVIEVPPGTRAGTEVTIWLDANGAVVTAPMNRDQAVNSGVIAGVALWLASLGALTAVYFGVHLYADRCRRKEWERDLTRMRDGGTPHQD